MGLDIDYKDGLVDRLETSIQFLIDGLTFTVGDFVIGKSDNGRIFVNGCSHLLYLENIDRTSIKEELFEIKTEFIQLMKKSQKFSEFVKDVGIDYYLLLDYGQGGIQICGEVDSDYKVFID